MNIIFLTWLFIGVSGKFHIAMKNWGDQSVSQKKNVKVAGLSLVMSGETERPRTKTVDYLEPETESKR